MSQLNLSARFLDPVPIEPPRDVLGRVTTTPGIPVRVGEEIGVTTGGRGPCGCGDFRVTVLFADGRHRFYCRKLLVWTPMQGWEVK